MFELDALVCLNGINIAFELTGTHYLHKNMEMETMGSSQGRKMIKRKIIEAYGVKICEINSWGLV